MTDGDLTRPAVEAATGLSLLREAQRRHDDEGRDTDLYLDVPTWDGDLVARYGYVERETMEELARAAMKAVRTRKGSAERTRQDMDLILKSNVGLYMRNHDLDAGESGTDDLAPIEDDVGLVTYARIGTVLAKKDFKNAYDAVVYLFSNNKGKTNGVAIADHAVTIAQWVRNPRRPTPGMTDLVGN